MTVFGAVPAVMERGLRAALGWQSSTGTPRAINQTYWAPALASGQASQYHPQHNWTGFQQVLFLQACTGVSL